MNPLDRIAEKIVLPEGEGGSRWAEIKNGAGEVTGYIEMLWGGQGWVSIPGASRVIDAGSEKPQ